MRNIYDLIRQKETELESLERDIAALRVVAPLLVEGANGISEVPQEMLTQRQERSTPACHQPIEQPEAISVAAPLLIDASDDLAEKIRARRLQATDNEAKSGRFRRIVSSITRP